MIEITRKYFVAEGESLSILERLLDQRREVHAQQQQLVEELGGKCAIRAGDTLIGLTFAEPPARLAKALRWKTMEVRIDGQVQQIEVAVPNRRSNAGKELHESFRELRLPNLGDLTDRLLGDVDLFYVTSRGFVDAVVQVERIGDVWILMVPDKAHVDPPGARPVQMSEYWRLKEAAEAAKAS